VFSQPSTKAQIIQFSLSGDKEKVAAIRKSLHREIKSDTRDVFQRKVDRYIQEIKLNEEWLESVRKKAKERGISLDSMLYLDAVYMVNQE
jgi:protoheme ferro-lyase